MESKWDVSWWYAYYHPTKDEFNFWGFVLRFPKILNHTEYDSFGEEIHVAGFTLPTHIKLERYDHRWNFRFCILGLGFSLYRQWGY